MGLDNVKGLRCGQHMQNLKTGMRGQKSKAEW